MAHETIGSALGELKRRAGLSLNAIAKKAGYSGPSSVQTYFHPDYDPPALDVAVAHKLVAAFEGIGTPPISPRDVLNLTRVGSHRYPLIAENITNGLTPIEREVRVYETRHGSRINLQEKGPSKMAQYMHLNMDMPVRIFPAQAGLYRARGAFAIYMSGDAMTPRFNDGEPIFVDPLRSPSRGEDVLVRLTTGIAPNEPEGFTSAIVGLLVARGDDATTIRQHRPATTARIPAYEIQSVYRIIPWAEVCGASYG